MAFPGMGKTPLAQKYPNYVDLDFGYLREAFHVAKEDEHRLVPAYAELATMYSDAGYNVLLNEPKVMNILKKRINIVYLPTTFAYVSDKLNVQPEEAELFVQGWYGRATGFDIPVKFIDAGLDKYIKS